MVFQVPAPKASIKQNRFEFKLPGDKKTYSLPKMQYLPAGIKARMGSTSASLKRVLDEGGQPSLEQKLELQEIQRELLESQVPGLYDRVTEDQLQELVKAWQEASGISVGESSASAD